MEIIDIKKCTDAEFQDWYHKAMQEDAQTDPYEREILKSAERIIEEKNYSLVANILKNYDTLVKRYYLDEWPEEDNLPYWCYAFGMRPSER